MRRSITIFLATIAVLMFTACGSSSDGDTGTTPPPTEELPTPPVDGTPVPPESGNPTPPESENPTPPTDELSFVTIYPNFDTIPTGAVGVGFEGQWKARAHYNVISDKEGYEKDITNSATWTSSNTAVASISSSGVFKALSAGSTEIKATYLGEFSTYHIDVIEAYVESLIITPSTATISVGDIVLLTAKGLKTDGTIVPVNEHGWETSNNAIASVDYFDGVVEGIAAGTAIISTGWHDTIANVTAEGEARITVQE